MKQHEVDAIFEKAEENQVILELWDRPAGEIRLVDLKAILNSFVVKDEIRAMTPLEHQWMDFKKILSELVVFQEDYEEQTKDTLPGNQYYSDKLMVIVNNAKQAISESELPSVNFRDGKPYNYCPTCGREEPPEETDEEISLRMWGEYGKFRMYKSGKGASPKSFPNWLKDRRK